MVMTMSAGCKTGENLDVFGVLEAEGDAFLVGGAVGGDDHDGLRVAVGAGLDRLGGNGESVWSRCAR